MEDVFRFRYRVYCEEKKFLPAADYPEGLETDEFDNISTHVIVHGGDAIPKGYLRVVECADQRNLPLFAHGMTTDTDFPVPAPGGAVEISRMMVSSDYRKRLRSPDDGFRPSDTLADPPARNASDLIQLKLLRLAYHRALEIDARWFVAAIEPAQGRKLGMLGFPNRPIGPVADYYGSVRPHAIDMRELERKLRNDCPAVWAFFENRSEDIHTTVIRPGERKASANRPAMAA
ncbi:PEP-CTERM/exosortase system-associated acyltransferase [Rhizobium sp. BK176]|uniref:PEP-CTERM/exosortase system-associated acyltransferase n=1 Tax=Rhizobium sp. BK176 TaxID=2587071 RepID=UPI0021685DBC|nr:PEP-CTERM/exosortase system-associated acyltransferase [Rhizobium sp. BK176]MCS4089717.1 N-acyl amino acid synthase of PEP-CTERM/exosortase system [Rhizobium sp. BK176]